MHAHVIQIEIRYKIIEELKFLLETKCLNVVETEPFPFLRAANHIVNRTGASPGTFFTVSGTAQKVPAEDLQILIGSHLECASVVDFLITSV